MKIITQDKQKILHIVLTGECTIYDADQLHKLFLSFLQEKRQVQIDVSGVSEMDTAVFQLLIALKKDRPSVVYVNHSPAVLKFIDLYGLAGTFADPIRLNKEDHKRFPFAYGIKRERKQA